MVESVFTLRGIRNFRVPRRTFPCTATSCPPAPSMAQLWIVRLQASLKDLDAMSGLLERAIAATRVAGGARLPRLAISAAHPWPHMGLALGATPAYHRRLLGLSKEERSVSMTLRAQEVFTPGAFPSRTYIERSGAELEKSLRDAIDTPG